MFDSQISAKDLISDLKDEIDIALEIPDNTYVTYLNELEQMLYSNYVREQNELIINSPVANPVVLSSQEIPENEDKINFEDIFSVYINNNFQLIKVKPANGIIFPNTYWKSGVDLKYNCINPIRKMRIIYYVKPKRKEIDENGEITGNIMVPLEFIDLVKAKLRSDIYLLVNEDAPAANWNAIYNALLVQFNDWVAAKEAQFG